MPPVHKPNSRPALLSPGGTLSRYSPYPPSQIASPPGGRRQEKYRKSRKEDGRSPRQPSDANKIGAGDQVRVPPSAPTPLRTTTIAQNERPWPSSSSPTDRQPNRDFMSPLEPEPTFDPSSLPGCSSTDSYFNDLLSLCSEDAYPCNNPECGDGQPCTDSVACCDNSECLSDICYKEDCPGKTKDPNNCCDQSCDKDTLCASPCYGQGCDTPPCAAPCGVPPHTNDINPSPATAHDQASVCFQQNCLRPHLSCVDPRCLSNTYQRSHLSQIAHSHHFREGENVDGHNETMSFSAFQPGTYNSYFDASPRGEEWTQHTSPWDMTRKSPNEMYMMPYQLDPITQHQLDFGSGLPPNNVESTPPELSASLTTTPSTPASWSLPRSPGHSVHHTCLWTFHPSFAGVCGQTFPDAEKLHRHVERDHIDRLPREDVSKNGFFCHWSGCNRYLCDSFGARPKLKRHAQTHTCYKPYTCQMCGNQMKTKDAMEKHIRTHSGERPYSCREPECGKEFATSTELKTHGVVHSGNKPHLCPFCCDGFADSSNLSKHKKTHFIGMYTCEEEGCPARMKRWDQMARHMSTQKHTLEILRNPVLQKEYKLRMERVWKALPEEAKLIKPKRNSY